MSASQESDFVCDQSQDDAASAEWLLKKEIISGCATKSEVGQGIGLKGSIGEKLAVYPVTRKKLRFAIPK